MNDKWRRTAKLVLEVLSCCGADEFISLGCRVLVERRDDLLIVRFYRTAMDGKHYESQLNFHETSYRDESFVSNVIAEAMAMACRKVKEQIEAEAAE